MNDSSSQNGSHPVSGNDPETVSVGDDYTRYEGFSRTRRRDILIAGATFAIIIVALVSVDFFEWFFEYSRQHETFELDEIATAMPALAIACAWYAFRRWQESVRVSDHLRVSIAQLEAMTTELETARDNARRASLVKSNFLAMMRRELVPAYTGPDRTQTPGKLIADSPRELREIIDEILELSMLEAGPIELRNQPIYIANLLDQLDEKFLIRATQKGLELSYFIDPALPPILTGDTARLMQILGHFVDNALKFTEAGGISVSIRAETLNDGSRCPRFEVADTGPGLDAEQQSMIFENFSRIDPSDVDPRPGVGIGLAICRKLADHMSGRIGVESEPGVGSTFWFTAELLPASPASDTGRQHEQISNQHRVLVVDDNLRTRYALGEQIAAWGTPVECVASGIEAMATLRRAEEREMAFDIAIIDQDMPGMDGIELAERIGSDPGLEDTSIVMMSAAPHLPQEDIPLPAIIRHHLQKPIRPEALKNRLDGVVVVGIPAGES